MSASGSPYSADKMSRWAVRESFPPRAPKQVQMVLSDLCQMDCVDPTGSPWCAYRMPNYTSNQLFVGDSEASAFGHNNPKRFMPGDRALSLLDEMHAAGVLGLQFTGGGEPLLHPRKTEIFQRALSLGFKCALVSNGLAIDEKLIQILADFSWVRISIDAGTAETYSRTRTTSQSNFSRVLGHIRQLSDVIRDKKTPCTLGVGFVVMPHNWHEIDAGMQAAKEAGAHNIRLSAMFSNDDEKPYIGLYDRIKTAIAESARRHESESFRVYDLFGDRIDDLILQNPDYPTCAKMHYCSYIGADMQLYMCCVYSYNERGKIAGDLGNLKDRRFDDFWFSDERKKFMQEFQPSQCVRCQFNPSNREINRLIDANAPPHMEFP